LTIFYTCMLRYRFVDSHVLQAEPVLLNVAGHRTDTAAASSLVKLRSVISLSLLANAFGRVQNLSRARARFCVFVCAHARRVKVFFSSVDRERKRTKCLKVEIKPKQNKSAQEIKFLCHFSVSGWKSSEEFEKCWKFQRTLFNDPKQIETSSGTRGRGESSIVGQKIRHN